MFFTVGRDIQTNDSRLMNTIPKPVQEETRWRRAVLVLGGWAPVRRGSCASQRLVLPQQAEALHQALHPHVGGEEEQQQAGAGRAVHADHCALLRQETLGQRVAAGWHRRLQAEEAQLELAWWLRTCGQQVAIRYSRFQTPHKVQENVLSEPRCIWRKGQWWAVSEETWGVERSLFWDDVTNDNTVSEEK